MRVFPFAAVLVCGLGATAPRGAVADPLPRAAHRVVDYRISVRLDAAGHRLAGRERLVWRNPSADEVPDLWFHLYLNAFRNSRTTFFTEAGGVPPALVRDNGWGWIDVVSIRLADGTDVTRRLTYEHPDDGNPDDRTVARLLLPRPVPPGGQVSFDVDFKAQLPRIVARTGYDGDAHLVAQWFPKLGVYEPPGMRGRAAGGWNCHQFHATTEFYADYGRYRVDITVPSRFVVGATGRRIERRANADGSVTHVYQEDDVHDFAWTADPGYVEVRRRFVAADAVSSMEYERAARLLDRPVDELRLSDVDLIFLMQASHMPQLARHDAAARAAIKYFGLWYGRYPYSTLTVVDPRAVQAAGMEYPTFITVGTFSMFNRWPFDRVLVPEQTLIHEFGHQYWYGLVGSNEFEEAWLDEGVNSYSTGRIVDRLFGPDRSLAAVFNLRIGEIETARATNGPDRKFEAILTPAWQYHRGYGFNSYQKPELALGTLERLLGEQTMARIMRTYHERWRFRHPSSDDFFAVAGDVAGRDLDWFFDPVVRRTDLLDYEVAEVRSVPVEPRRGVLDGGAGAPTTAAPRAGGSTSAGDRGARTYESTVVVRRRGEVVLPVDIEFRFSDGSHERVRWDGRRRWTRYRFVKTAKIASVDVDPDRKLLLDVDWLNNTRRLDADYRVAAKWTARWWAWIQHAVALAGL